MIDLLGNGIFDEFEVLPAQDSSAKAGRAKIRSSSLIYFATDSKVARGAIGVSDGLALSVAISAAREQQLPLIWLLDCAGAKVDEGLPALAAFRRFYREALLAKQSGVRILAVLGRGCYGGASLLAMLADHRIYTESTRLSTSGPAIIESVEGTTHFNAADQVAVSALLGAKARLQLDPSGEESGIDGLGSAIEKWLFRQSNNQTWEVNHDRLASRLPHMGATGDYRDRMQALLPSGYNAQQVGNIVHALPPTASEKAVFCGYLSGGAFGANDAWQMVDVLSRVTQTHRRSPIVLMLDASGHAARAADEKIILAEYLVHLCQCINDLGARGHKTALWIMGGASGAVYVVFAAPVQRVSVLTSARVEVLASSAVDKILGRAVAGASAVQELVDLGIADAILDSRLDVYQTI